MIFDFLKRGLIKEEISKEEIKEANLPSFKPIDVISPGQTISGSIDIYSSTWIYIESYLNTRIDFLRTKNDNQNLSYEKTMLLRGAIKEIKKLISHAKKDK